ncbi:MAG TPA: phosphatidylglycerol lysyltransferase domain-containing protein [Ktedonobacteraceae bacterium]|jgi:lysylphosphatidylglycerol synthetase-like protein (DUF2156 family)|nr:phosphatidylglycerol lysyltransferase domain-containing protein [Ktedonobacteraceae bacterium]
MIEIRLARLLQLAQAAFAKKEVRVIIAFAVALMGIMNALAVLLPVRRGRLVILVGVINQFAPFTPSIWPFLGSGRTLALILGFFLCLVASGLVRGKRRAWEFAAILLPLSAVAHLIKGLDIEEAVFMMVVWGALLTQRSHFRVKSDPWSMWQGFFFLALGFTILLFYSIGGFYLLRGEFIITGALRGVAHSLLNRTLNLPAQELIPLTRRAEWFLDSIPFLSVTALITGMVMLLRPVSARWWVAAQKGRLEQVQQRAQELVRDNGAQTLSFFALAPQNLRYLAPGGTGVVNYRVSGSVAVVLGDPICIPGASEHVMRNFLELCTLHDWLVTIYMAHPEYLPLYYRLGLHAFKIGEEALLNPQTFTCSGSAMANVRTSARRAEREQVEIRWYEGVVPAHILKQMQLLSQQWLEDKGVSKHTPEMGFSMGRLSELDEAAKRADAIANTPTTGGERPRDFIPRLLTAVAFDRSERVCAFVTFTPIYGVLCEQMTDSAKDARRRGWGWGVDLMRRSHFAPPGIMELLLVRAIERFRAMGADVLSLGVIALADTKREMTPVQQYVARSLSQHIHFLETHRTLMNFKMKFHPEWQSRYMVLSNTLSLPRVALALLRVHQS